MKRFMIAMSAIKCGQDYILQQRVADPKTGAPGLIGFFGGKIEAQETSEQAVCREIDEETSLQITPDDLEFLGEVNIKMNHPDDPDIQVNAQVFQIEIDEDLVVVAKEGGIVKYSFEDARKNLDNLTPATKAAFNEIIMKGKA